MNTELTINAFFAALFGLMALICLAGAAFCGTWWHLHTFLLSVGLSWTMFTARNDNGQSAWKQLKKFITEKYND